MTKDDRAALYAFTEAFVPSLVEHVDPQALVDDTVMQLVGESFAMMDAEIVELRECVQRLERELADAQEDALNAVPLGKQQVPDAQLDALLRHHKIQYHDVHLSVYIDDEGVQRTRKQTVRRPANALDVIGQRETGEAVSVVLADGRRHLLAWPGVEVA